MRSTDFVPADAHQVNFGPGNLERQFSERLYPIAVDQRLDFLESRGVYVSSGSACSKGASSPVLAAMGLPSAVIDSALRVSLIYDTTPGQIDRFADALESGSRGPKG